MLNPTSNAVLFRGCDHLVESRMTLNSQELSFDEWANEVVYSVKMNYGIMKWTKEMVQSQFKEAYEAGRTPYQLLKSELGEPRLK